LRDEIGEIEELYSYVKGLVKKRLDQNTGEPVESQVIFPNSPRGITLFSKTVSMLDTLEAETPLILINTKAPMPELHL